MGANRAKLTDTINKTRQKGTPIRATAVGLRLAGTEESTGSRVRRLADLAAALMREADVLARDKAFADQSARLDNLDVEAGVDFYNEVKQFETALIKLALGRTAGNQAQAAKLLGLQATTLNSKIKLYGIEY